jgi:carboxyl-terminal processing protease
VRGARYLAAAFSDIYGRPVDVTAGAAVLDRGTAREFLTRAAALPAACRKPISGKDPRRNAQVFAATFADHYPFFAARNVGWAGQAAALQSGSGDLFDRMVAAVTPLKDDHVTIEAGKRRFDIEGVIAPGLAPDGAAWTWASLRRSLRDRVMAADGPLAKPAQFAGNRRVLYGRTVNGFGYIAVLAEGGWAEGQTEDTPADAHVATADAVMDAILTELHDVRGMIVDLRVNSGGFDAVGFAIASRFAAAPVKAFTRQAGATPAYDVMVQPHQGRRVTGPVAVLIGPNTVSAGESMTLAFGALPQARLFGQATRGALSDQIPKSLPNGWGFSLSIEQIRSANGDLVEVAGVQPDQPTPPSTAWGDDIVLAQTWLAGVAQ